MKNEKFVQEITEYKTKKKSNNYDDFTSGLVYRNFERKFFPEEKKDEINIALTFNTDGSQTNPKNSFWPFFLSYTNVNRCKKRTLEMNPMVALVSKKRPEEVFKVCCNS